MRVSASLLLAFQTISLPCSAESSQGIFSMHGWEVYQLFFVTPEHHAGPMLQGANSSPDSKGIAISTWRVILDRFPPQQQLTLAPECETQNASNKNRWHVISRPYVSPSSSSFATPHAHASPFPTKPGPLSKTWISSSKAPPWRPIPSTPDGCARCSSSPTPRCAASSSGRSPV